MSSEKEMAEENKILLVRTGSHLYGTNTETSDEDFVGVFIPNEEYILGFKRIEQVDSSIKKKYASGKNAPSAVDITYYTLEKFARLALDNNPNILELLFVNEDNIVYSNSIGKKLLDLKYEFLSKNLKHRFLGYAFSQKHKMVIKLENYEKIEEVIYFLVNHTDKLFLNEIIHPLIVRKKERVLIGDITLKATTSVKKAIQILDARKKRFGSRKELVSKYGYDVKFGMHLMRLILEGQELLQTGNLVFPLQYKDYLLEIRQGKYNLSDLISVSETMEKKVEELYETSILRATPNFSLVEDFVIKTHRKKVCKS